MNKNWRSGEYNSILVIIDCLTKIVYYGAIIKTRTAEKLETVVIDTIICHYGFLDFIVTDYGFLFTSQFWFLLNYFINIKR